MGRNTKKKGFKELSPNQTAADLFGHLKPGEKVAIVTRFSAKQAKPYTDALEQRGLKVRVIEGQSGTEDFCFLMSAQKEIIGKHSQNTHRKHLSFNTTLKSHTEFHVFGCLLNLSTFLLSSRYRDFNIPFLGRRPFQELQAGAGVFS